MEDRDATLEYITSQIRQRVTDLHGEDRARTNQDEIETLATMVKRLRRLEVSTFKPLDPDRIK